MRPRSNSSARLHCDVHGKDELMYFMWEPGFARPLDTTSRHIHDLNDELRKSRGWYLRDPDEAADYLRLFCAHVWGDDGPFSIVESRDSHLLQQFDWSKGQFASGSDLEAVLQSLKPVECVPHAASATGLNRFGAIAYVCYGDALYRSVFAIDENGLLEMPEDEPLAQARRRDGAEPTRKPFAHASRPSPRGTVRVLSADAFLAHLGEQPQKNIIVEGATVHGDVVVDMASFDRSFSLRNCCFRGRLDLRSSSYEGALNFDECVFEGGLVLNHAQIERGLVVRRSSALASPEGVAFELDSMQAASFTLQEVWLQGMSAATLRIAGSITFDGVDASRAVVLDHSVIGGQFTFHCTTQPSVIDQCFSASHLRAEAISINKVVVVGWLSFFSSVVKQSVDIQNVNVQDSSESALSLYNLIVENGYTVLDGCEISGGVDATFLRVGTGLYIGHAAPTRIGGDLSVGGADIPQLLEIRSARIGGRIQARSVTTGTLRVVGNEYKTAAVTGKEPESRGFEYCSIGSGMDFCDANISHDAVFAGVRPLIRNGVGAKTSDEGRSSLELRHARVGGDVLFFLSEQTARRRLLMPEGSSLPSGSTSVFSNGVDLTKARVEGDVDLSHLQCLNGVINLEDADIAHDLRIVHSSVAPRASALGLQMEGLTCKGSADLTGLDLRETASAPGYDPGHVHANHATFEKLLRIGTRQSAAGIPGRLDLSNSRVGHLELSNHMFDGKCDLATLRLRGVLLNRATIAKATLTVGTGYPCPIDLRYADVRWWEFANADGHFTVDTASNYGALLRGDPTRQRHSWQSIESNLVNSGHVETADEVHKQMRQWAGDTLRGDLKASRGRQRIGIALRIFRHELLDLLTDSMTSVFRPAMIIIAWGMVSTWLFSVPHNVVSAQDPPAVASTASQASKRPARETWDLADGLSLALRFHIPIIAIAARSEWKPANDDYISLSRSPQSPKVPFGTPEDYATFVALAHWLLWPIALFLGSRKVLRRVDK